MRSGKTNRLHRLTRLTCWLHCATTLKKEHHDRQLHRVVAISELENQLVTQSDPGAGISMLAEVVIQASMRGDPLAHIETSDVLIPTGNAISSI